MKTSESHNIDIFFILSSIVYAWSYAIVLESSV